MKISSVQLTWILWREKFWTPNINCWWTFLLSFCVMWTHQTRIWKNKPIKFQCTFKIGVNGLKVYFLLFKKCRSYPTDSLKPGMSHVLVWILGMLNDFTPLWTKREWWSCEVFDFLWNFCSWACVGNSLITNLRSIWI